MLHLHGFILKRVFLRVTEKMCNNVFLLEYVGKKNFIFYRNEILTTPYVYSTIIIILPGYIIIR